MLAASLTTGLDRGVQSAAGLSFDRAGVLLVFVGVAIGLMNGLAVPSRRCAFMYSCLCCAFVLALRLETSFVAGSSVCADPWRGREFHLFPSDMAGAFVRAHAPVPGSEKVSGVTAATSASLTFLPLANWCGADRLVGGSKWPVQALARLGARMFLTVCETSREGARKEEGRQQREESGRQGDTVPRLSVFTPKRKGSRLCATPHPEFQRAAE